MKYSVKDEIQVQVDSVSLDGALAIPENAHGLVLFAHGSGSSRLSPRNNFVAERLQQENIGTFLFDLLTEEEDEVYETRFNIDLLTERLITVTEWIYNQPYGQTLNIGYFGSSTGAASALKAAAHFSQHGEISSLIKCVVSRGGRPDMAIPVLDKVKASVLLIVGGLDHQVIELNEEAMKHLKAEKELKIVEGASHLFSEPGKLEEVADLARDWFKKYLS